MSGRCRMRERTPGASRAAPAGLTAPQLSPWYGQGEQTMSAMQFGMHLPHLGRSASRDVLRGFARAAEETGFDSLWVSDHVIVPRRLSSRYPYNETGEFPFRADAPFLDPIATLLFIAGCTERVKLGTAVLIVPYRNPVVQAKELATLDFVSGGRLILGIGTGWMAEEFEALDVPFAHRGSRTNEYLRLI